MHRQHSLRYSVHDEPGLSVLDDFRNRPLRQAITGVPQAKASIIASPNFIYDHDGHNVEAVTCSAE